MADKERLIDANALKEDFLNDYTNYMMETLRGNHHDVIRISEVIERIENAPTIEVEPVTWYTAEENQPDSVGDDVLVVDSYGKYHIAYYLSGSEIWMNQDAREPIKDVVKWRYLDGDKK